MELKLVLLFATALLALGGYVAFAAESPPQSVSRKPFASISCFCDDALKRAEEPTVRVYFFTSQSCGPCSAIEPVVDKLIKKGRPIVRVEAGTTPGNDLAKRYRLTATPTFVVVEVDSKGKEKFVERWTGGVDLESRVKTALQRK